MPPKVRGVQEFEKEETEGEMEKLIIVLFIGVLFTHAGSTVMAQLPGSFGGGIEESPHNFSHPSWLPVARICNVCHTLHNESISNRMYSNGLLWKSDIGSITYVMYHSYWGAAYFETRDKSNLASLTGRRSNLPDGLSKLCLACHDGIIAPDVFLLHHFVSAEYDVTTLNLRDPDFTLIGNSGTISEVLDNGKIQCSSCHDVHGVESVPDTKLLRAEKPRICLTCHNVNIK